MGAVQPLRIPAEHANRFRAWRVVPGNPLAYPLDIGAPVDLLEALNEAQLGSGLSHKDTLLIHERHAGKNRGVLRSYAIKQQSKANYRRDPATGIPRAERPLYPDLQFEVSVPEFEPERPFDALRDNAAGRDLTLVTQ